jgi:branched-chain amino acid aminotransferase
MYPSQLFAVTETGPQALPVPEGASSVHDIFDALPLGVYSALRTFEHNKFLDLEAHLARTEQSMALLGWTYQLDRPLFCRSLHEVCTAYPGPDARVRFDVLAAPATMLGSDSRVLIALSPFEPPPAHYYREGVQVSLAPALHREQPLVKTADFVLKRRPFPLGEAQQYEHLLLDEAGHILEGSSSNFYAIDQGALQTAGEQVLAGITRRILLQLAADLGLPVTLQPLHRDRLPAISEAFLSSASRGLLPIVAIAGQVVGDGRPGPVTRQLMAAYDDYVRRTIRTAI